MGNLQNGAETMITSFSLRLHFQSYSLLVGNLGILGFIVIILMYLFICLFTSITKCCLVDFRCKGDLSWNIDTNWFYWE